VPPLRPSTRETEGRRALVRRLQHNTESCPAGARASSARAGPEAVTALNSPQNRLCNFGLPENTHSPQRTEHVVTS
jgi:hypothetical protein